MNIILGLIVGIGLSAACGFRVFVPMMGMSIAVLSGNLTMSPGFEWIGTWPALLAFTTATVLEIATYYIPWVDNMMDTLTTPAAIIAGTIMTASMVGDISPFLKWTLAFIVGGGISGIVQGGTVALRAGSSGIAGGLTNPIVSTAELIAAIVITILALILPVFCMLLVVWICYKMVSKIVHSSFIRKFCG